MKVKGEFFIIGALAVSLIPILLAWRWLALLALAAIVIAHREITREVGETMRVNPFRLVLRIVVDLGVPIVGFLAALRVWDPISASAILLLLAFGVGLSLVELITQ